MKKRQQRDDNTSGERGTKSVESNEDNKLELSWNGQSTHSSCRVHSSTRRFGPKLIFLMEVKVCRDKMERVIRKLQSEDMFCVEGVNNGGGLALIWKERDQLD